MSATDARRWPLAAGVFVVVLATVLLVYRDSLLSLVDVWLTSATFTHGIAIVPISLYLIFRQRAQLQQLAPRVDWWALPLLLLIVGVWLLARLIEVRVGEHLALVAAGPALVWLLLGRQVAARLSFPLAFLIFAVPFGESLTAPLMEFTADFTTMAIQLTGIPIFRNGLFFSVPSGDFEVAKACSGIRYLIASVALGTLFAYLTFRSWRRRIIFVAFAIAVPIVANGVRAYLIVMIAHLSNMKLAVGVDHFVYGWVFFGIVMLLLFWIGGKYREDLDPPPEAEVTAAAAVGSTAPALGMAGLVAALILGSGPLLAGSLAGDPSSVTIPVAVFPPASQGWQGPGAVGTEWRPAFDGAAMESAARYTGPRAAVDVFVYAYGRGTDQAELINTGNSLVDGRRWVRYKLSRAEYAAPDGALTVTASEIGSRNSRLLVWSWFDIAGRETDRRTWAKVFEVLASVGASARPSALITVAVEIDALGPAPEQTLREFLDAHLQGLRDCTGSQAAQCVRP